MTEGLITALISGLPATIAALGGLMVSIRNGRKADVGAIKTTHIMESSDANTAKTLEIHQMVNDNLSAVKAELAAQTLRAQKLETMLATLLAAQAGEDAGKDVINDIEIEKAKSTEPETSAPKELLKPNFVSKEPPIHPEKPGDPMPSNLPHDTITPVKLPKKNEGILPETP